MALSHPESNDLTHQIIGSAMAVHKYFGPGLKEITYEESLYWDLYDAGRAPRRQVPVPIFYKTRRLESSCLIDLIVEDAVVIEVKAVEKLIPIHDSQVLTYLKLTGCRVGLLINFNTISLLDGIKRISL
jgi:GxxExxY protein